MQLLRRRSYHCDIPGVRSGSRPRGPLSRLILIAGVLNLGVASSAVATERFNFEFKPPDGAAFHRIHAETGIFETSVGPFTVDSVTTERYSFRQLEGGDYECDYHVNAYQATLNAVPMTPYAEPMLLWSGLEAPVTFSLTKEGRAREVRGMDILLPQILARGESQIPAQSREGGEDPIRFAGEVGFMLDSEILQNHYHEMIGTVAGLLHGRALSIGQTLPLVAMVPDEEKGGFHRLHIEIKAERVVDLPGRKCVEVILAIEPTPPMMVMIAREIEAKLSAHNLDFGEIKSMAMKQYGTYVVDPATLLPRSQTLRTEVRMNVLTPEGEAVHLKGSLKGEGRFF